MRRARAESALYATDNGKMDRGRNYPPKREWGQPKPPIPDVGWYLPNPGGLQGMTEETREWVND